MAFHASPAVRNSVFLVPAFMLRTHSYKVPTVKAGVSQSPAFTCFAFCQELFLIFVLLVHRTSLSAQFSPDMKLSYVRNSDSGFFV